MSTPMDSPARPRRIVLAVVLSLLHPLLGSLYVGRAALGLVTTLIVVLGGMASLAAAALTGTGLAVTLIANTVVTVLWYLGMAVYAAMVARREGAAFAPRRYNRWPFYGAAAAAVAALFVINPLRLFVLDTMPVPASTMLPTILPGDVVIVAKLPSDRAPAAGDLILFYNPLEPSEIDMARVTAVPGDTVAMESGVPRVRGQAAAQEVIGMEKYAVLDGGTWMQASLRALGERLGERRYRVTREPQPLPTSFDFGEVPIPEGAYFVLADNRDHSMDSRNFGPVPHKNIIGRVRAVLWSRGPEGLRWDRLGQALE